VWSAGWLECVRGTNGEDNSCKQKGKGCKGKGHEKERICIESAEKCRLRGLSGFPAGWLAGLARWLARWAYFNRRAFMFRVRPPSLASLAG
jgi:hypothetical protein